MKTWLYTVHIESVLIGRTMIRFGYVVQMTAQWEPAAEPLVSRWFLFRKSAIRFAQSLEGPWGHRQCVRVRYDFDRGVLCSYWYDMINKEDR